MQENVATHIDSNTEDSERKITASREQNDLHLSIKRILAIKPHQIHPLALFM